MTWEIGESLDDIAIVSEKVADIPKWIPTISEGYPSAKDALAEVSFEEDTKAV